VATQRSYGMDLLRWFRFCWAIDALRDQATRSEAHDFWLRIQIAAKPVSPHLRQQRDAARQRKVSVYNNAQSYMNQHCER
jgi:hypothetical protein